MESNMETSTHECPTGILVSFEEQENPSKFSSFATLVCNIKGLKDLNKDTSKDNEKSCKKEKITLNAGPSHLWAVNNIPDRYPSTPRKNMLCTPKSNWRTPSPKSMKIISHDASRIVDRLYSSPLLMSSSEILLSDEIFPAIKSFDGLSYEEVSVQSENVSSKDTNLISDQVPSHDSPLVDNKKFQEETDLLDMTKCHISSAEENDRVSSECTVMADAKNSATLLESKMIHELECNSKMEKLAEENPLLNGENASNDELTVGRNFNDGGTIKMAEDTVSTHKQIPAVPEFTVQVDGVHPTPTRSLARCVRSTLNAVKGFGFKSSIKRVEKDKENTFQQIGKKPVISVSRLSKIEKNVSVPDELQVHVGKSQVSRNKSIEQSSMKRISCATVINERKDKSSLHLGQDNYPEEVIVKCNILPSKSNFMQYRQLPSKKIFLGKSASTETPSITKPVRRSNSLQTGSAKFSIPTVGKPAPSGIGSCSKALKPRMSLSRMSLHGTGLSTPLKCDPISQNFPSAKAFATNPKRRISQISRPSTLTDVKPASLNDQHSAMNKSLVSASNGKRFSSRLDLPSPLPKFMNDSLPRKLF